MFRVVIPCLLAAGLLACQPRYNQNDGGVTEEDAGVVEVDAGRQQGEDPPTGFKTAAALPDGGAPSSKLGVHVSAVPDQFNQPLIAALYEDPNGDLNWDDNRVVFTRWDGVAKAYDALKSIETVGGGPSAGQEPNRNISMARDPDTGRLGVAYVKGQDNTVRFAFSDDEGLNWSLVTVSDVPRAALMSNPVLAMKGGTTHVGWIQGSDVMYRKRVGPSGAFVDESPAGATSAGRSLALALDSAGNPGLAFFVHPVGSVTSAELAFWRPGGSPAVIASADMLDLTPREFSPSVTLTFVGTTPHLAYHLRKSADATATELWYLKSNDTGASWAAPAAIPRNCSSATECHSTRYYQALAIEPTGRVTVAAPWSAIGTQINCNGPKLARSPDGVTFMTCAPAGSVIQRGGEWINLWTHRAGKQTLVFHYDNRANNSVGAGIVVWREP